MKYKFIFSMIIDRYIEHKVRIYFDIFPVTAIVGPRQCGKTTFAKYFIEKSGYNYIYLDLEKTSDFNKLENAEFYFKKHNDKCIIIDEIQRKPDIFPLIRAIVDEYKQSIKFIILGSASPELLKQSSETLAGRIGYIELGPFHAMELNDYYEMKKHHFYGGFPLAFLAKNNQNANIWIENFIKTYLERDLPMLGLKANPLIIRRLWEMLAWQSGSLINYNSLANSLGVSNNTIKNYITFLEESYLVYSLQPWFLNISKRLVKSPKIYIADTGVLHRLLSIYDYEQLLGFSMLGNSWENYVINQIKMLKPDDFELYFYRTHAGAELDLLLVKGLIPKIAVEIKFTANPLITKGLIESIETLGTQNNYIIVPLEEDYPINENIVVCSLNVFLTKYLT